LKKTSGHTFLKNELKVKDLQANLDLSDTPEVIECFDISHLSGTSMVGRWYSSGTVFRTRRTTGGSKINTVEGIDDVASIGEIVKRRYQRLIEENTDLPDLIIIDGGKGQLSAALEVLGDLDLVVPVIAVAKRRRGGVCSR